MNHWTEAFSFVFKQIFNAHTLTGVAISLVCIFIFAFIIDRMDNKKPKDNASKEN